jgi:aspartyl/asparaginyl-tRNA synthetase
MIEAEVAFVDDIAAVLGVVESAVRQSVAAVAASNSSDIEAYLSIRANRKVEPQ